MFLSTFPPTRFVLLLFRSSVVVVQPVVLPPVAFQVLHPVVAQLWAHAAQETQVPLWVWRVLCRWWWCIDHMLWQGRKSWIWTLQMFTTKIQLYMKYFFNTLVVVIVSAWWPRGSRSGGLVRVVLWIWRTIDGGVGPCQSSSIKPSSTLQVWLSTKTWEKKLILFIRNFILYLYLPWTFYTVSS